MPTRMLREGILDSRAVNALSEEAELFYRHLMSVVDDFGRVEADIEILRLKCFPRRLDAWPVERLTHAVHETASCQTDDGHPLVTYYEVGPKRYLQINNFQQRIRAGKSKCPPPVGHPPVSCQTDDGHLHASRAQGRTKSNAETKSNANARAVNADAETLAALPPMRPVSEYPQTADAVRSFYPATDDVFVLKLVQSVMQSVLSGERKTDPTDAMVADAVRYCKGQSPKQNSVGLFLRTVPQCVHTWCMHGRPPTNGDVPRERIYGTPEYAQRMKAEREEGRRVREQLGIVPKTELAN